MVLCVPIAIGTQDFLCVTRYETPEPSNRHTVAPSHRRTVVPSYRRTVAPSHRRTVVPPHLFSPADATSQQKKSHWVNHFKKLTLFPSSKKQLIMNQKRSIQAAIILLMVFVTLSVQAQPAKTKAMTAEFDKMLSAQFKSGCPPQPWQRRENREEGATPSLPRNCKR